MCGKEPVGGKVKNLDVLDALRRHGVEVDDDTIRLVKRRRWTMLNCGCVIHPKPSRPTSDLERLIAEIERLITMPPDKTTRPPPTGPRIALPQKGKSLERG